MTPALPYLAPWYRVATDEDKVVLEYGQRMVCFEGRAAGQLLPALLPLIDGTRTVDEIVHLLGEPARPAIDRALGQLEEHGILLEGPPLPIDVPQPVSGTVELLTSLHARRERLTETAASVSGCSVAVVGDGAAGIEIGRLLRQSGLEVGRADEVASGVDLTVCAPAPAELPRLRDWNEEALDARQAWLQVLPFDGRYASLGPLYLPGETCCYECFRLRRASNLDAADELPLLESTPASYPGAPALHAVVGGLAALLALEWLVLGDHYAPAAFYALELLPVLTLSAHHVHRVPRCPACSGLADVAPPLPWHKEIPIAHS
jgi:bacteriocin biosynthesis cyclodehydratase domain-containing protein